MNNRTQKFKTFLVKHCKANEELLEKLVNQVVSDGPENVKEYCEAISNIAMKSIICCDLIDLIDQGNTLAELPAYLEDKKSYTSHASLIIDQLKADAQFFLDSETE